MENGTEGKGIAGACGCGDDRGQSKGPGALTGFLVGVVAVLVTLALYGRFGGDSEKAVTTDKASLAELRLKVAETAERNAADRKAVEKALQDTVNALQETRNMLVLLAGKTKTMEDAHNALVKELQGIMLQNNRAVTTLDRALRDKFGKDKWFAMVKDADMALAGEAAEAMKAQLKAEEERAKAQAKEDEKRKEAEKAGK